jgi:hypothetical protein
MALIKLNNQSLSAITSAGLPSGSIIQVQKGILTTQVGDTSLTAQTWTDTGLSVTITPTSSSNDIMLSMTASGLVNDSHYSGIRLLRGTTEIQTYWTYNITTEWTPCYPSIHFIDSPSTTSATTYKVQMYTYNGGSYFRLNYNGDNTGTRHVVLSAMEIAG